MASGQAGASDAKKQRTLIGAAIVLFALAVVIFMATFRSGSDGLTTSQREEITKPVTLPMGGGSAPAAPAPSAAQ